MAFSYVEYVSDGQQTAYSFRFVGDGYGYFRESDIHVIVGGVEVYNWTLTAPNQLSFSEAPAIGARILIRRIMPKDLPYSIWKRGNDFSPLTTNNNLLQQLYAMQELYDGFMTEGFRFNQDLSMGGYRITDLADGINPNDAVNLSQLTDTEGSAGESARQAAISAAAAKASELAAKASEIASKISEDNSKLYMDSTLAAENSARASAGVAKTNADSAAKSKDASSLSETEAAKAAAASSMAAASAKADADRAELWADKIDVNLLNARIDSQDAEIAKSNKIAVDAAVMATSADVKATEALELVKDVTGETPFPDVWIPFNENLDMLAGTNFAKKKVKFGEDTILYPDDKTVSFSRASTATYIDKSGVLRTAAIDEPRFEREGLLIEGQSTNIIPYSSDLRMWPLADAGQSYPDKDGDMNGGLFYTRVDNLVIGNSYTLSASAVITEIGVGNLFLRLEGKPTGLPSPTELGEYYEEVTFTATATSETLTLYSGCKGTNFRSQLEGLPFATSFIPTNGAAATRAADICKITQIGNMGRVATASLDLDFTKEIPSDKYQTPLSISPDKGLRTLYVNNGSLIAVYGASYADVTLPAAQQGVSTVRWDGLNVSVFNAGSSEERVLDNGFPSLEGDLFIGSYSGQAHWLFGHIRNFRIWHSALTDGQIKSLA